MKRRVIVLEWHDESDPAAMKGADQLISSSAGVRWLPNGLAGVRAIGDDRDAMARLLGDLCVELLKEHEAREHGGDRCFTETSNLLAYLNHRVGLHFDEGDVEEIVQAWSVMVERTRDYDAMHEEHHA